jgi:MFS family permease
MFLFMFIDKANIGNARLAGLEEDLGLRGNDYNAINSIFYISYIVFGFPSNLACKMIGPGWYLPALTLAFEITSIGNAYVRNFSEMAGVRFLLGMFEAGLMPGTTYYVVNIFSPNYRIRPCLANNMLPAYTSLHNMAVISKSPKSINIFETCIQ